MLICGQSYGAEKPLMFKDFKHNEAVIEDLDNKSTDESDAEIGFRVVLEP